MRISIPITLSLIATTLAHAYPDYGCGNYFAVEGDWTMMKRGMLDSKDIVKDGSKITIETSDFIHSLDYEPGFRLGFYYRPNVCDTLEVLYLDAGSFETGKHAHDPQNLTFPFKSSTYSYDFTNADSAYAQYSSTFWTPELNYWRHVTPRSDDVLSFSWLVGGRYINLDEHFHVSFEKGGDKSHYSISTKNHAPGAQGGFNLQWHPTYAISWDILAKVGILVNWVEQHNFLSDFNNTVTLRDSTLFRVSVPFLSEISAAFSYLINKHVNVHGGYQALYITNVCLAPEQIDFSSHITQKINAEGSILIKGWFLGLNIGF